MAVVSTAVGFEDYTRAILNILEDFVGERDALARTERAVLNILEDAGEERDAATRTQQAVLNILDDFRAERDRLEQSQKAVLNILEDFEEEKAKVEQFNRDLVARTGELARSNSELEQFAYVASHDLQEPLRMVSSYVQLLQQRYAGKLDERADKYIYYAVDGARRMQALIQGLLEYSRVSRRELVLAATDAGEALESALLNLRQAIAETGARVEVGPLPVVEGDPARLAQVFQNLLANAIKFRKPGQVPHIRVQSRRTDHAFEFSIRDDGIGLDPRYADQIFNIFQRLHTRNEYPGTGIGLAVCKKVVERHGGRIWVESEPGRGADFRFTLPLRGR
ncbi:MAG: hypothetical protein FJZ01_22485 [Candidatus Sericytochromatia bacterium]|nr:hypothetical protein [Candidatus Tanganyikabacteria bacterium]